MSTLNIPLFYRRSKIHPYIIHISIYYSHLTLILVPNMFMVPNMFELSRFDCTLFLHRFVIVFFIVMLQ